MKTKSELRQHYLSERHAISKMVRDRANRSIWQRVIERPEWQQAKMIGCYLSLPDEVSTEGLIQKAWEQDKTIAAPIIKSDSGHMDFHTFQNYKDLRPGPLGIFEPLLVEPVAISDIDLLIVPGVAFDRQGYRIGYGRGYFDRYLSTYTGPTLGVAFDLQIAEALPTASHDLPVNLIVTESRVIIASVHKTK